MKTRAIIRIIKTKYLQLQVWLGYRSKCCHAKIYDAPPGYYKAHCAGCDKVVCRYAPPY